MTQSDRSGVLRKWKSFFLAGAMVGTALATPATRPADKPARDTVEALTAQGLAALAAQNSSASVDNFLDAKQLLATDHTIAVADPLRIQAAQGLAVAYLQAGKYEKAGEVFKSGSTLDHAMSAPNVSRSLIIDRAVLDVTQKFNVMRAIKMMKDYLTAHPDNDEEMLNIFGTAIDRASYDERYSKAPLFEQANKFYDTASAKLEETKPGQKRWGITWISQADYDGQYKVRQGFVDDYNKAATVLTKAKIEAEAADDDVNTERSKAKVRAANHLNAAVTRQNNAEAKLATATKEADEKKALIPHYPWLTALFPALPESANPTVAINTPATAKPSGETPHSSTKRPKKKPAEPAAGGSPAAPAAGGNTAGAGSNEPPATGANDTPAVPTTEVPAAPEPSAVQAHVTKYAAAFPIGPDLFLTAAAAVGEGSTITLEDSQGNSFTADFVRSDDKSGLGLVRVAGKQFGYLHLGDTFAGGEVHCTDFPTVSIFSPAPQTLVGRSSPIKTGDESAWYLAFQTNPRLSGAPVTTADGTLVGVAMAQRDSSPQQVPAVRIEAIKAFLGDDLPKGTSAADPTYVLQLTATSSK